MQPNDVRRALRALGWPIDVERATKAVTHQAILDFQRMFAWWWLSEDGNAGPKTARALEYAVANGGRCSPNFRFVEFKSKGNGWIRGRRSLLLGLEDLREVVGAPIGVLSGYRDPDYNEGIGSVDNSQHVFGNAIDPLCRKRITVVQVKSVRAFSGIGIDRSDGRVRHLDVRHRGPNTTNSTIERPAMWDYA